MCGIVGISSSPDSPETGRRQIALFRDLLIRSQSRGRESAGVAWRNGPDEIVTAKIRGTVRTLLKNVDASGRKPLPESALLEMIGHSRLVTDGDSSLHHNNQPVIGEGEVVVHNGIITNHADLWAGTGKIPKTEVDSEVLLPLLAEARVQGGWRVDRVFRDLRGSASFAYLSTAEQGILLATNTGSLYVSPLEEGGVVFASEHFILEEALKKQGRNLGQIRWVQAGECVLLLPGGSESPRSITDGILETSSPSGARGSVSDLFAGAGRVQAPLHSRKAMDIDEGMVERASQLRRCTRCILPETFPFIQFDTEGICNFCRHHVPMSGRKGTSALESILDPFRSLPRQNCIVPLSGGRDSFMSLHLLVHRFRMKPVSYTYDWGMVTPLARRNIARICGDLGIENILVSADIGKKRKYIRQNIQAWMHKPDLGMIPLFMAGDKWFFYYLNQVRKETGISLNIWSGNQFENTDFKAGFSGIAPRFGKERIDSLDLRGKLKLMGHFASQYLLNPRYINTSVPDTLGSYWSYYLAPRTDYHALFDYEDWNEEKIDGTIINQYGFEQDPEAASTWRIGDGTAPFYNYIYMQRCGFTETDTFRSNQIRAGHLSREQALMRVQIENNPRPEGLRWYLESVGLDPVETLKRLNGMPRLHPALDS